MCRPLAAPRSSPGPTWGPHAKGWPWGPGVRRKAWHSHGALRLWLSPTRFHPQVLTSHGDAETGTLCRGRGRLCRAAEKK